MADDRKTPLGVNQETSAWEQYEDELTKQREVVQNKVVQDLIAQSDAQGNLGIQRRESSPKKGYAIVKKTNLWTKPPKEHLPFVRKASRAGFPTFLGERLEREVAEYARRHNPHVRLFH
eukprot:1180262-Prorocentrum_minimum.AAC.4